MPESDPRTASARTSHAPWLVERWHHGELADRDAARAARRTGRTLDAWADSLADADARFLVRHPPGRVAASIHAALARPPRPSRWLFLLPAGGLALVPLLAAVPVTALHEAPRAEVLREKGDGPSIRVWRRTPGGALRLSPGSAVHRDDVLQVGVASAGGRFGVLLSVDGRGHVTTHAPEEGTAATRWVDGGEVRLPRSYTLDDAPGFERFVLVLADAPFDASTAFEAAARAGADPDAPLPLPPGFDQVSFTVRKEAP